jgi:hypothetical protein
VTGPGYLGAVEVDVELNVRDVGPRLRRALRRPAERVGEEVERQWVRSGGDAGRSYADAFRKAVGRGDFASGLSRSARRSFDGFTTEAERAADRAKRALAEATRSEQLLRIDADIRQAQAKIRELESKRGDTTINVDADIALAQARIRSLAARRDVLSINVDTDGLDAARKQMAALAARSAEVAEQSQRARHAIGSLVVTGAKITAVGAAAGGAAAVMGSLAVNALAVGAALGQAAGSVSLLPAALGSMTASVGALVVGFQGMGEALGAVMDEDPDKLADAMKELTPAARSAVRAFQSLRPQLAEIREATQEALFKGLDDDITRLNSTLLPKLESGLSRVAEGLNKQFEALFSALSDSRNLNQFDRVFENTAKSAEILAPAVEDLVRAFSILAGVGSNSLPRLANAMARTSERFADFMEHAEQTGELADFIDRSIDSMAQLGRIVGNVGVGVGGVFSAASEASGGLLDNLEELTARFREWSQSAEGQATMVSLFESIKDTSDAVMPVLRELADVVANTLAPLLADLAEALGPSLATVIDKLGQALDAAAPGLNEFAEAFGDLLDAVAPLLPALGEIVSAVGGAFATAMRTAAAVIKPLVDAFKTVNDALGGIPGRVLAFASAVLVLRRAVKGDWLGKFGRDAKDAKGAVGGLSKGVEKEGDKAAKTARTAGQKIGRALRSGVGFAKKIPGLGLAVAIGDELVQVRDTVTGETEGIFTAAAISIGRAWDFLTGKGAPVVKVKGQAQTIADAYGEAMARIPQEARNRLIETSFVMKEQLGMTSEQAREFANRMAQSYLEGLQNMNLVSTNFWSNLALDIQTGTTNMNTAVTSAMTSMQAVMSGGLSLLQVENRSVWQDIYTVTHSNAVSASEAVNGAMAVAKTAMTGGLAAMVSASASSWDSMRNSTVSGGNQVRSTVRSVANGLAGAFGGLPGKFYGIGQGMMAGLRDGIMSMALSVALTAGNVVAGAVNMAKRIAQINSPSRVFMEIGRGMGEGLAIGMQQMSRTVAGAGGGLAAAAVGGAGSVLDGMPGLYGGTGGTSTRAYNNTSNVTNHFTITTAAQDPRAVAALVKARIDSSVAGVM